MKMKTKKTDLGALDSEAFIRNVLEKNFKQKPDIKTKAA